MKEQESLQNKVGVSKVFSRYMYNCVKECILI